MYIPIVDKRNNKSKSLSMRAAMKNKNMSQIMNEAWQSKPGSTKRERAKSVLKSFHSLNSNVVDGQGGESQGLFPWAWGNVKEGAQTNWDITKGVGSALWEGGKALGSTALSGAEWTGYNLNPMTGPMLYGGETRDLGDTYGAQNLAKQFFPSAPAQPTSGPQLEEAKAAMLGPVDMREQQAETDRLKAGGAMSPQVLAQLQKNYPDSDYVRALNGDTTPYADSILDSGSDSFDTGDSGMIQDDSYLGRWFSGMTDDQREQWKSLYEAVGLGLGPEAFAVQTMGDIDELKRMFPGVNPEELPVGASLSRQIADLKERLQGEHTLNSQLDRVNSMRTQGVTIEQDLHDYMTSRDQYIEKLDGMIDGMKHTMTTTDMSNPNTRRRMESYQNYLYLMKGRQQKRYADFLSDGVNEFQAKLTNAENMYNTSVSAFNDQFQTQASITAEDYSSFKTMIKEMYTHLDGMEMAELELDMGRAQLDKANWEINSSVAASLNPYAGYKMKAIDVTNLENLLGTGEGGTFNLDRYGAQQAGVAYGIPPQITDTRWLTGLTSELNSKLTGDNSSWGNALTMIQEAFNSSVMSGSPNTKADMYTLFGKVRSQVGKAVPEYLRDQGAGSTIKSMLKDLTGIGVFDVAAKTKEQDEFVKRYGKTVDKGLVNQLFESYFMHMTNAENKDNQNSIKNNMYQKDMSDSAAIAQAAGLASAYWEGMMQSYIYSYKEPE